jgi:endonuclease YncB( thermonuclease family)
MRRVRFLFIRLLSIYFLAVLTECLLFKTALSADLTGIPRVVDGDTLVVNGIKIRLEGVDAPESDQLCLDEYAQRWTCGITARDRLERKIGSNPISCSAIGEDKYKRTLAICRLGSEDLNRWLVREGLALSFVRYSHAYDGDEIFARENRLGLWSGAFVAPWDWRHRNGRTIVLGAQSVPLSARPELLSAASSEEAPSPECVIKGNVSRTGKRLYHMPGQVNYAQIKMDKGKGERWFCSEEEALVAGWHRARR